MSELTKRLRIPYEPELADYLLMMSRLGDAADRIDALEECLRDFLAEHDNAAIEQPDAKTLILYWARNNDTVTKARAMLEEK